MKISIRFLKIKTEWTLNFVSLSNTFYANNNALCTTLKRNSSLCLRSHTITAMKTVILKYIMCKILSLEMFNKILIYFIGLSSSLEVINPVVDKMLRFHKTLVGTTVYIKELLSGRLI